MFHPSFLESVLFLASSINISFGKIIQFIVNVFRIVSFLALTGYDPLKIYLGLARGFNYDSLSDPALWYVSVFFFQYLNDLK